MCVLVKKTVYEWRVISLCKLCVSHLLTTTCVFSTEEDAISHHRQMWKQACKDTVLRLDIYGNMITSSLFPFLQTFPGQYHRFSVNHGTCFRFVNLVWYSISSRWEGTAVRDCTSATWEVNKSFSLPCIECDTSGLTLCIWGFCSDINNTEKAYHHHPTSFSSCVLLPILSSLHITHCWFNGGTVFTLCVCVGGDLFRVP